MDPPPHPQKCLSVPECKPSTPSSHVLLLEWRSVPWILHTGGNKIIGERKGDRYPSRYIKGNEDSFIPFQKTPYST